MIVFAGALIGAALGVRLAARRGGRKLDMAQYGAACAIAGTLAGLILTIVVERLA